MRTIAKTVLGLGLSLFIGSAAFAQTADHQDKDKKDKDKHYKHTKEETSQFQGAAQDLTTYDRDQDGKLSEEEFALAYSDVEKNRTPASQGDVMGTEQEGATEQEGTYEYESEKTEVTPADDEFISSRFENLDEDGDGYIDEEEYTTWINDTDTK